MRKSWLAVAALGGLLIVGGATPATERSADRIALRVLYVGNADATRGREYLAFLKEHFAAAKAVQREGFDTAAAADWDVVLLDWSQRDVDIRKMAEVASPLGPRDEWNKPTVLLGSAGLLLSGPWEIAGGYG
jgi:hypothetical protein